MVDELAHQFPDVPYVKCRLSDYGTVEEAWTKHLGGMMAHHQDKKPLIACLDEADTKLTDGHVYHKLLGAMAGAAVPDPCKPNDECVLKNAVWFFLASSAATCEEFEARLHKIDREEKARDFWNRFESGRRIDVPFDPDSPEERIIKAEHHHE